jgi:hypothetical protein
MRNVMFIRTFLREFARTKPQKTTKVNGYFGQKKHPAWGAATTKPFSLVVFSH